MENSECRNVPISGKMTIDANGRLMSEYEYCAIPAKDLASLLIRGFGIDVEDLFVSRDGEPAA